MNAVGHMYSKLSPGWRIHSGLGSVLGSSIVARENSTMSKSCSTVIWVIRRYYNDWHRCQLFSANLYNIWVIEEDAPQHIQYEARPGIAPQHMENNAGSRQRIDDQRHHGDDY